MTNKFGANKQGSYDSKIEKVVAEKYGVLEDAGMIRDFHRSNI